MNLVITAPADGLAHNRSRPSAGLVLTEVSTKPADGLERLCVDISKMSVNVCTFEPAFSDPLTLFKTFENLTKYLS